MSPTVIHTSRLFTNMQEDINALFKVIPAFIMTLSPDGRILAANNAACEFMQTSADQLLGKSFDDLWASQHEIIHEHVSLVVNLRVSTSFEVSRNGQVILIYMYPIESDNAISSAIAFGLNITDRVAAKEQLHDLALQIEEKVSERTRELGEINKKLREEKHRSDVLAYFSQLLLKANQNYRPILQAIAEDVAGMIGEVAGIALFSADMQFVELAGYSHTDSRYDPVMSHFVNRRFPLKETPFLKQALQKANYKLRHVTLAQLQTMIEHDYLSLLNQAGYKTLLAIPLMTDIQVLGLLVVGREENEADFTDDELVFLNSLTSAITLSIQNARLIEELRQSQARVRGVSQQLVQNQETQFRHLAREMHDQVGQDMTAININLNLMRAGLSQDCPEALQIRMDDTIKLVEDTVEHIRSIMAEFRPPVLDAYGLTAALYWYAEQYTRRTNIEVMVNDRGLLDTRMAPDVEIGLFRIAQEALNNAAKHSKASRIDINLSHFSQTVNMEIHDNGVGFDLNKRKSDKLSHWGLAIMRERTESLGGRFLIQSKPTQGVTLTVAVPGVVKK